MIFKLQYKRWMKAISVIFVLSVYVSAMAIYTNDIMPLLEYVFIYELGQILSLVIYIVLIAVLLYALRSIKHKVFVDSCVGTIKVYSINNVFWRSTDIDTINSVVVQKNSDMKYSWIKDDALIITLVTRHHKVKFPLSEDDWEKFKIERRISAKEVLFTQSRKI